MECKSRIILEDNWEVLDSGSFIHSNLFVPFKIQVVENDGTEINARFIFVNDPNLKDSSLKVEMFDKNTFQIKLLHNGLFVNFGFKNPIPVGTYNNRDLMFNFRVDLNGNEDSPLINYTWLINKDFGT